MPSLSSPPEDSGQPDALNASQWIEALDRIGNHPALKAHHVKLCVIGSVACMFDGDESRTTIDCDVWTPASELNRSALKSAVEGAGLLFDPRQEIVERPYIQLVKPGLVQVGDYENLVTVSSHGQISISRPPIANLIASKLIRGSAKDVQDISGMISRHPDLKYDEIESVIATFPSAPRRKASDNLVYASVLMNAEGIPDASPRTTPRKSPGLGYGRP